MHITHMNVKLMSQIFHTFWSTTSYPKSLITCNFEGYLKLEIPEFFISQLNVNFLPRKTSRLKSCSISTSRIFQNPKFYMISICTLVKAGPYFGM